MKNFFDCKDEKITEKAFTQSMIISVVSILLCLVVLCSMTYAWFSADVSSSSNIITSGNFDLEVSVVKSADGVATTNDIEKDEYGILYYTLTSDGSYTFTLTRVDGSTANGYCYVTVGSGTQQPTETIVDATAESAKDTNPLTFTVTGEEGTIVKFEPRWGINTNPVIKNNGTAPVVETEQDANE